MEMIYVKYLLTCEDVIQEDSTLSFNRVFEHRYVSVFPTTLDFYIVCGVEFKVDEDETLDIYIYDENDSLTIDDPVSILLKKDEGRSFTVGIFSVSSVVFPTEGIYSFVVKHHESIIGRQDVIIRDREV